MSAGDMVHVPRGATHHFVVVSTTARYLAGYAPGGEEQAFKEAAAAERGGSPTRCHCGTEG